jgi:hypothetical protein
MKNDGKIRVFLVHGWDGSPNGNWFPWLQKNLNYNHFSVVAVSMPNPGEPKCEQWVEALTEAVSEADDKTILIGHSLGCITILRYLEKPETNKILAAILVAGFSEPIGYEEIDHFFTPPLDYAQVKKKSSAFIAIQSDDDPYVPFARGITMNEKLDATIIPMHNGGHIGLDDGFAELPELLELINDITQKYIY